MGAKPSSLSDLQHNPVLQRFTGDVSVGEDKEFWEDLLSFSFSAPYNSADARLLEESTEQICRNLASNNLKSQNFVLLVKEFLRRASELHDPEKSENFELVSELHNALLLIRSFCKYFIEVLPPSDTVLHFGGILSAKVDEETGKETFCCTDLGVTEDLLSGLFEVLLNMPTESNDTYAIHIEAINTLLVLLSVQMFDISASSYSIFYHAIMRAKKCKHQASKLIGILLQNFAQQQPTPDGLTRRSNAGWFSSLWSWFGSQPTEEETFQTQSLLANQSLLLLLVLVNHCTQDRRVLNPYRQALFSFNDERAKGTEASEASFLFNMEVLYTIICSGLEFDQTTLLLYLLLHRNPNVSSFTFARKDIDKLVLPILKLLYSAEDHNAHHIYMSLIILLILSQNEAFNKSVHEITVSNIPWYTERTISNITLGGLLVLVVLRTIQYNMTKMRDKYLHTNCLATLANMSSQFHALHPYVTQRIVSLYALLSKKHAKVMELIKQFPQNGSANGASKDDTTEDTDYVADLAILEEVIRMVLEIINSCVTNTLHHNPNLVYTLLHRRELFAQFRSHPTFQDIIQNIDTVLAYFSARLEQHPDQTLSVGVVLDVIKQGALQWPKDRLKKFPELKFKYVEEEQPEEFFIPYVWSLVYKSSLLYWNPEHIEIFHPDS
ncbi:dymeclin [Exaiptasia diaphana]|uniref:Dymeclin n=1 Tax=Exaiptasia diaphana TaxID=2652724 RepID=A0A913X7W5_EXADI|nr:dymeclin [Exaiptasia diaphana]KXJ28564.1 Dymeclin [Exaiptasia diaphana]